MDLTFSTVKSVLSLWFTIFIKAFWIAVKIMQGNFMISYKLMTW